MKINKKAQQVIDRIANIMQNPPKFDSAKIEKAMKRHYELLGVPMPQIQIANDMVIGYKIAQGAALDAARGVALDAARNAAWCVALDAARDVAWCVAQVAAWDAALDAALGVARGVAWGVAQGAAQLNTGLKDIASLLFIEMETELLKAMEAGLGFYFPMKDKLILVPMPEILIDERKRPHSTIKAAINWKKGAKFYFLHGVRVDKKMWKDILSNKMSFEDIMKLTNIDQRMVALKYYDIEKLLLDAKAILIDDTKKYQLYKFDTIFPRTQYAIKYVCPSTGRIYISFVPPEIGIKKDVVEAMSWKFQLNKPDKKGDKLFDYES